MSSSTSQNPGLTAELRSFFQDPDASSAVILNAQNIAAPVVQGQTLTPTELKMGGGIRLVQWVIDRSGSMGDVADTLIECFNDEYEKAVKEARQDDISALRVGGIVFSSGRIQPIWEGQDAGGKPTFYHPIDKLPPLTRQDYSPDGGTPLHTAIQEGMARAVRYAAEQQLATGIDVDVDLIILSDGANTDHPLDSAPVRQTIENRDKKRVRVIYFYMETWGGLKDPKGYAVKELGIDEEMAEPFLAKPGETKEQQRSRFRRLMQVASRVSGSKNTSAVVASAAVQDDEELA